MSNQDRQSRYRLENPEKAAAHDAVTKALRDGDLVKPLCCEGCGDQKRLTGHHEDYSKPLVVIWLCGWCHYVAHHEEAAGGAPARRYETVHVTPIPRPPKPRGRPIRGTGIYRLDPSVEGLHCYVDSDKPGRRGAGVNQPCPFRPVTRDKQGRPVCTLHHNLKEKK